MLEIGKRYTAHVLRVVSSGLLVSVHNAAMQEAVIEIVKLQEISSEADKQAALKNFKTGQTVPVKVYGKIEAAQKHKNQRRVRYQLSIRLAHNDPWESIEKAMSWQADSKKLFFMQVASVNKQTVKGEVLPGVTAQVDFKPILEFFKTKDAPLTITADNFDTILHKITIHTDYDFFKACYDYDRKAQQYILKVADMAKERIAEIIKSVQPVDIKIDYLPLRGDTLAGYITSCNTEARLVDMDVLSYIKDLRELDATVKIRTEEPPLHIVHNPGSIPKRSLGKIKNILFADDDKDVANTYNILLREEGFLVHVAYDLQAAKTLADDEDIDLALVDLHFPEITKGLSLLHYLAEKHPYIKTIITTADINFPSDEIIKQLANVPIVNYLPKPLIPGELITAILDAEYTQPVSVKSFFSGVAGVEPAITVQPAATIEKPLKSLLLEIIEVVRANAGAIFEIHPLTFNVAMRAWVGIDKPVFDVYKDRLHKSPIREHL